MRRTLLEHLAHLWAGLLGRDIPEFPHLNPIVTERAWINGHEVVTHTNVRLLQQVVEAKANPPQEDLP